MGRRVIEMIGKTFGRLTVLELVGRRNRQCTWLCSCACGGTHVARGDYLRRGQTKCCLKCLVVGHPRGRLLSSPSIEEHW